MKAKIFIDGSEGTTVCGFTSGSRAGMTSSCSPFPKSCAKTLPSGRGSSMNPILRFFACRMQRPGRQ